MTENIIVALIVAAAVGFTVRSLWKTLSGKGGCSCGGACKSCKDSICNNRKK